MKKNIFLTTLLAISGILSAQSGPMSFGAKGGYTLSSMKYFGENLDSKSYFYVGILAEKPLSSKFSVQAEVLYTQLGGKDSYPGVQLVGNEIVSVGDMKFDYTLHQIQVPISAKYYFIPNLSASVGMNFGFNISSKVTSDTIFGEVSGESDGIKTLNLFPFLGAEYKITDKFFVDARYHFNFFEANKSNAVPTKIGFLQAGVGYRFK
ncbi:PorT family protein [Chryseobacterium phosphatilyticum]|uniref:PorT family protein n=1 Tax=Chryseobacterium phosphatilyticum TaxID=475075 RepID=A0A316XC03_9FLAO|nr:porin family protein [Chryseobacterium phosphatilyticum]PWN68878.1 PorT family protein [Chryseobacterium phosphatilyticum]